MTVTSISILYHANCPDGFSAAWVAQCHLANARLHPMNYGEPVPDIDGHVVWVLDYCFPPDQLVELCERAEAVRILDHHETAVGYLEQTEADIQVFGSMWEMPEVTPLHWAIINQQRSGVGLTMEWFDEEFDWLLRIEDRDLWRWSLPDTADVFAAVTSREYTLGAWDELDHLGLDALRAEGAGINRYRDQIIDQCLKGRLVLDIPGVGLVAAAQCPYAVGSDVAGHFAEQSTAGIGAYFMVKEGGVRLGLRSRNGGPNVATLAKDLFGGGGHPQASGFEVSYKEFFSWL
jgi:hypothetical protein